MGYRARLRSQRPFGSLTYLRSCGYTAFFREPMESKTASRSAGQCPAAAKRRDRKAQEEPRALTVKVDGELYQRLLNLRATQRRTHQDILEQALNVTCGYRVGLSSDATQRSFAPDG
jgi:hypothetical protein